MSVPKATDPAAHDGTQAEDVGNLASSPAPPLRSEDSANIPSISIVISQTIGMLDGMEDALSSSLPSPNGLPRLTAIQESIDATIAEATPCVEEILTLWRQKFGDGHWRALHFPGCDL